MPLRLEDLKPEAQVTGLIGREAVRTVSAQTMGEACDLVFRDAQGNLQSQILFRDREADLELKVPDGIDDATARIVLENSRSLMVDNPQMY